MPLHDAEDRIMGQFELLTPDNWAITSDEDWDYNCIAWALGRDDLLWWPMEFLIEGNPLSGYYWPYGLPLDDSLDNFIRMFARFGYTPCESHDFEVGYQKVALYASAGRTVEHAARQRADGSWTSKLGPYQDIKHDTLGSLTGKNYGLVAQVLRRPAPGNLAKPPAVSQLFSAE